MIKKTEITDVFIDNFDRIHQSDLKKMRDILIKNGIPDHGDEATLIKIIYFLEYMTESDISVWKKNEGYIDYLQKIGKFNPATDDSKYTDERYLAGTILLTQSVSPEKVKPFFSNLNYYNCLYLSYKLGIYRLD